MALLKSLTIPLGSPAPDFNLTGIDQKKHSLSDYTDKKVLLIIFMCNHCPYVQAIWPRLVDLANRYQDQGVQFIGINPNFNPDYPEDSFEKMQEYAQNYNMTFPYLQDTTQEVARVYQAQCTPDIYLFNAERKLAYHGRLDDNWQDESAVTKEELAIAIEDVLAGKPPAEEQIPCMGCSIKWQ